LDLLASGIAQGLHATEISRVGLDQVGIELMLSDELAKPIANGATAAVSIGRLRRQSLRLLGGVLWFGEGSDFLN